MKILFINGSPKGRFSITLQSCLYLEKRFPEHSFEHLNAGAGISTFEKDMHPAAVALAAADLIIFSYPVYTFLVPSQLHRFIELIKENGIDLKGKYVTQLTTSKHFYDVTAHRFIEDNCRDMGMRVIKGLSADMEDLLSEQGRKELEDFFNYTLFCVANGLAESGASVPPAALPDYESSTVPVKKSGAYDIVIVGDLRDGDDSLRAMIKDFDAASEFKTRFVNIAEFPFKGGCLGCLNCTMTGQCVYKDGFDRFLRESILSADAVVYAFTLRDHSMGSRFKMFDDRQFCNGHRTVTEGRPVGYICRGDICREENLRTVLEARAQVGHNFFAGIASGKDGITELSMRIGYALNKRYVPPRNFYGVGGMKIFRDLVWLNRGIMREDHRFYKSRGMYDFPQRRWPKMLGMSILGAMMRNPAIRRRIGKRFTDGMLSPYRKVLDELQGT